MPDEIEAPLALVASVTLETDPVRRRLHDMRATTIGRKPAWQGTLAGRQVILVAAGMGKTNAAQAVSVLLETGSAAGILSFGVGGAYPEAGLVVGDVALASEEIYGDEGVEAPGEWISAEGIGIPLLEREGLRCFNRLPLDEERVERAAQALDAAGVRHLCGPFVTVSTCSGTLHRGVELRRRFGALCETMEGAAAAHVALLYEAPFLEVRGISNLVEDRDLRRWALGDAAEAAAAAVEEITRSW